MMARWFEANVVSVAPQCAKMPTEFGQKMTDHIATQDTEALIKPLTSMRFFAAMMVVLLHTGSSWVESHPIVPRPISNLLSNGYMGVTFFLVLSGFLLQGLYRARFNKVQSKKRFFVARLARIYPVYLLSLIAVLPFVVSFDISALPQIVMAQHWLPTETSGFDNWNMPAWTLSCEMFFYLFFPCIAPSFARSAVGILYAIVGASALWMLFTWAPLVSNNATIPAEWMRYVPVPILRFPEFLMGAAVGELSARGRHAKVPPALVIATLVAVMSLTRSGYAAVCMAAAAALLCSYFASGAKSVTGLILSNPLLVLLGGASYSIYLLHLPVHFALEAVSGGNKLAMILQFPILIAVGVAVFLWFEEPMREKIRSRWQMRASVNQQIAG